MSELASKRSPAVTKLPPEVVNSVTKWELAHAVWFIGLYLLILVGGTIIAVWLKK